MPTTITNYLERFFCHHADMSFFFEHAFQHAAPFPDDLKRKLLRAFQGPLSRKRGFLALGKRFGNPFKPFRLSLTHKGLLPIASAHMYIFPYEKMNKEQYAF